MAESHDLKIVILHINCVKSIKAVNGLMWYIIKHNSIAVPNIHWPGKYSSEKYLYLLIETEVLYVTFKGKLEHLSHVTQSHPQILNGSAE